MKKLVLALPLLGLLAGCGTSLLPPPEPDRTQYFVLSGPPPVPSSGAETGRLRVGINLPIEMPDYLSGRAMVVRTGENQLVLSDFNRWAESLQDGILRLMEDGVKQDPAVARVVSAPFPLSAEPDYSVSIHLLRCEGDAAAGSVVFAASYRIMTTNPAPKLVAQGTFVAPPAAWDGKDYASMAALLSRDVLAFAQAIAHALPNPPG